MIASALAQFLRGFAMGAADVVPGVSGGTVALVLGIYERLVRAVRTAASAPAALLRGDFAETSARVRAVDFAFLVPLAAGLLTAVATLASLIEHQLDENPEAMAGLFFGLVAASVVVTWPMLGRRTPALVGVIVVVAAVVFVALGYQSGPVSDPAPFVFALSGALAVCAMILPGISGSFILLMIGMYAAVLGAVHDRDLVQISLTGLGAVIGLSLFSTLLARLLSRHHDTVMAVLIGLMVGSLRVLWPWPNGVGVISEDEASTVSGTGLELPAASEWFAPTALGICGAAVVLAFGHWGKRDLR